MKEAFKESGLQIQPNEIIHVEGNAYYKTNLMGSFGVLYVDSVSEQEIKYCIKVPINISKRRFRTNEEQDTGINEQEHELAISDIFRSMKSNYKAFFNQLDRVLLGEKSIQSTSNRRFVRYEFVRGVSVNEYLEDKSLSEKLMIFSSIAQNISLFRALGFVNTDPVDGVIVDANGQIHFMDLGMYSYFDKNHPQGSVVREDAYGIGKHIFTPHFFYRIYSESKNAESETISQKEHFMDAEISSYAAWLFKTLYDIFPLKLIGGNLLAKQPHMRIVQIFRAQPNFTEFVTLDDMRDIVKDGADIEGIRRLFMRQMGIFKYSEVHIQRQLDEHTSLKHNSIDIESPENNQYKINEDDDGVSLLPLDVFIAELSRLMDVELRGVEFAA